MNTFNKDTGIIISAEFAELVAMATDGDVTPEKDTTSKIKSVVSCDSGQTLFMVEVSPVGVTFPATVAQVQKMNKLWKKANTDAPKDAVVKATVVKVNPEPEEEINAASDDF